MQFPTEGAQNPQQPQFYNPQPMAQPPSDSASMNMHALGVGQFETQPQSQPSFYSHDTSGHSGMMSTNFSMPSSSFDGGAIQPLGGLTGADKYADEPPLLEELGLDLSEILQRTQDILIPTGKLKPIHQDADLAGPLCFGLLLGFFLLLTGKMHFGYIYGFGLVGCVMMYFILNLMSSDGTSCSFDATISILGYCLLPIIIMAFFGIVINLNGYFGFVLAFAAIGWSTFTATRLFEATLGMREQRYLVAYPVALLYACFSLITVF